MSKAPIHDDGQAVDDTGDPIAMDDAEDPRNEPIGPRNGPDGREIVVPPRVFKAVTVFSTLAAVVAYFVGFTLIDAATLQISFVRTVIVFVLEFGGVRPGDDVLAAALAIAGVMCLLFGTAIYILGTRFQGQGMRKSQEDSCEQ